MVLKTAYFYFPDKLVLVATPNVCVLDNRDHLLDGQSNSHIRLSVRQLRGDNRDISTYK